MQIIIKAGVVMGAASFTTGFISTPRKWVGLGSVSETDILAECLWLERHGCQEEADTLLERWTCLQRH
jgi:hypothetical protein